MGRKLHIICIYCGKRIMVGDRTRHLREKHDITENYRQHFKLAEVEYYNRVGKNLIIWVYKSLKKEGGVHIKVRDSVEGKWSETILPVEEARKLCRSIGAMIRKVH